MNEQKQPSGIAISPDEVLAAFAQSFGMAIGRLTFEKLQSEKQVQALQAHGAEAEVKIANLKRENSNLITNHIQLEGQIHSLKKELEGRLDTEQVTALEAQVERLIQAGPTIEQMSTLEAAKVADRNEKAAPVEAA